MAIQQRPKFYSDLLPGREFDTADEAETAEIEHKTREKAAEFVAAHPPYSSEKFNANIVETIVMWELWAQGLLPGQRGQVDHGDDVVDADFDPPEGATVCPACNGEDGLCNGEDGRCMECGGAGWQFPGERTEGALEGVE